MYVHTIHTVLVVDSSFAQIINDGASLTEIGRHTYLLNSSSHVVTYIRMYYHSQILQCFHINICTYVCSYSAQFSTLSYFVLFFCTENKLTVHLLITQVQDLS